MKASIKFLQCDKLNCKDIVAFFSLFACFIFQYLPKMSTNGFSFSKKFHRIFCRLTSSTRLLHTTKGHMQVSNHPTIDPNGSGLFHVNSTANKGKECHRSHRVVFCCTSNFWATRWAREPSCEQTTADSPYVVPLARSMTSSSVRKGKTITTGPKISSWIHLWSSFRFVITVGRM